MIDSKQLFKKVSKHINFFVGVPDSVLKNFTNLLSASKRKHLIAPNEGSAISIAIGYFLKKKKIPCVYMQNSGLGNAINPLVSIADPKVYSIPMILLIGWRGAPNTNDEPQHLSKGKITKSLLNLLKIRYCEVNSNKDLSKISKIFSYSKKKNTIGAILIKKNKLSETKNKIKKKRFNFLRSEFISVLLKTIKKNDLIISTTGYTSRELYQIRKESQNNLGKDFYMVGGMGHAISTSLGIASNTNQRIICLDGDGSLLMHLGSLNLVNYLKPKNLKHIIFNNNAHESVGGQDTYFDLIDLKKLSKSFGYNNFNILNSKKNLKKEINKFLKKNGPSFLEVKIDNGSLKKLSRPKSLKSIKENFINY